MIHRFFLENANVYGFFFMGILYRKEILRDLEWQSFSLNGIFFSTNDILKFHINPFYDFSFLKTLI